MASNRTRPNLLLLALSPVAFANDAPPPPSYFLYLLYLYVVIPAFALYVVSRLARAHRDGRISGAWFSLCVPASAAGALYLWWLLERWQVSASSWPLIYASVAPLLVVWLAPPKSIHR